MKGARFLFFIGLTISLSLLAAGIILIVKASYVIGGVLLALALISFFIMGRYYKKKRKQNQENNIEDCGAVFDCMDCTNLFKKVDCDCTPDYSP